VTRSQLPRPAAGRGRGLLAVALAALVLAACSSSQDRAVGVLRNELSRAGYSDARVLNLDAAGDQVQVVYTAKARNSTESSDEKARIKELVWNVYPHKLTKVTVQAVSNDILIAGTDEADAEEMQNQVGDRPPQVLRPPALVGTRTAVALAFLAGLVAAGLLVLLARAVRGRRPAAEAAPGPTAAVPAAAGTPRPGWSTPSGRPEVRRPGASEPGRDHPSRGGERPGQRPWSQGGVPPPP
jgi:hypothetical protein